jgi:uncharacterized protein (DUF2267 family)
MPSNVVKTKRDERLWKEAKKQAKEQGKAKNWRYIMGVFERMRDRVGGKKVADMAASALKKAAKKKKR